MSGIWYDQDSTNAFYNAPLRQMSTAYFNFVVDSKASSQVSRYFICPGSSTAIFDGLANEVYAQGFDLTKGSEQAAMCGSKSEWLYRFAYNLHTILSQGIDPVRYMLERAKKKGMEAWLSMRMNDAHCGEDETSPLHCSFWKQHPELRISDVPYENSLDFTHDAVRELVLSRALELLQRYDADGLQLDWTRFPTFLPHGTGRKSAPLITAMIEKISAEARRSGRGFGVRVLGHIDLCLERGLDVLRWAELGLIDYVVIAPFVITADFALPVEQWRTALGARKIPIIYGLDASVCAYPGAKRRMLNPSEIRGLAHIAFSRGAEAVYLFNFFEQICPSYPDIFEEIGAPETIAGKNRTVRITWHDNFMTIGDQDKMCRFPGWVEKWREDKIKEGKYPFVFPHVLAQGQTYCLQIDLGLPPQSTAQYKLQMEWAGQADDLLVAVNATETRLKLTSCQDKYPVEAKLIQQGLNTFTVTNNGKEAVEIRDFQMEIAFS